MIPDCKDYYSYQCVDCSCGRLEAGAKDPGGGAASTPLAVLEEEQSKARQGACAGKKPRDLLISNLTVLHHVSKYK